SHLKRGAAGNPQYNIRKTVIVSFGFADNFSDRRPIREFQATTESECEQLFRESADKQFGPLQQAFLQRRDADEVAAVRESTACIHWNAVVHRAPTAYGI